MISVGTDEYARFTSDQCDIFLEFLRAQGIHSRWIREITFDPSSNTGEYEMCARLTNGRLDAERGVPVTDWFEVRV